MWGKKSILMTKMCLKEEKKLFSRKAMFGYAKRCLSGALTVAMIATCVPAAGVMSKTVVVEAAESEVLSNEERGVIFADSRSDFRDESIYFMIVTRFYDGDESNNVQCWDGTQYNLNDPAWRGDFKGVIEKLDYIKALGFTAIWITPVVENCSGYDYHGYHALDMSKVDPRYESSDCTYQDLIDACHAKGIKVIQDIVLNHTGNFGEKNLYPMFEKEGDLSSSDCLKMLPDANLPSNYDSLTPGLQYGARIDAMKEDANDVNNIYHHQKSLNWDDYTCQTAQIAGDCVDLNTENPTVYNYLVDCYTNYINMGVDAFRIDTVKHISRLTFNKVFNDAFMKAGKENGKDFYMFGEVCTRDRNVWYRNTPALSAPFYTWKESKDYAWSDTDFNVNMASTAQNYEDNGNGTSGQPESDNAFLDGNNYHTPDYSMSSGLNVIDFPMHWNFEDAKSAFRTALSGDQWYNDATWNVTYVDSHDYAPDGAPENQRFAKDQDVWAENLSLMFTFRGIPCIYYGSEIEFKKGSMIDVGPNAPLEDTGRAYFGGNIEGTITATDFGVYGDVTGAVGDTLKHPLSQHIQRLNRLRQAIPALRKGQYSTDGCKGDMAFKRRYTDSNTDSFALVSISGDATFTGIPNGKYVDAITGDVQNVTDGILTAKVSGKGNLKVYVLDTDKTPAPGRVITNGKYLTDGGEISDITPVDINVVDATGITLDKTSVEIREQESAKVEATVAPADATYKNVSWTSSNTNVATVSGGTIKAVGVGTATITAKTKNGLTATVSVKVVENPDIVKVSSISVTPASKYMNEGETLKLEATITPSNATDKTVKWSSDNTNVAKVSADGTVTAVCSGNATITATASNGLTAKASIAVKATPIEYIENAIYFEKPEGWNSAYAYFFKDSGTVGKGWPGTEMKKLSGNIYTIECDTYSEGLGVVFNDGSGNQTADLEAKKNGYYKSSGYVKTITKDNEEVTLPTGEDVTTGNTEKPSETEVTTEKPSSNVEESTKKPDETEVTTKKQDETEESTKKQDETEVTTKKQDETEVTTKKQDETEETTKKPGETEVTTKKPGETETTKKPGEAEVTTKKPGETETIPDDEDETETTLGDEDETETTLEDETETTLGDEDETETTPGDEDETETILDDEEEPSEEENVEELEIVSLKTSVKSGTALVGGNIKITAKAKNNEGAVKYRFIAKIGNTKMIIRDYKTTPYVNFKPYKAGKYTFYVYAKDSSGTVVQDKISNYVVKEPAMTKKLTVTSSYKNKVNKNVKLTGKVTCGTYKYNYKFTYKKSGSSKEVTIKSYSSKNSVNWKPDKAGKYTLYVYAKNTGNSKVTKMSKTITIKK